MENIKFVEIFLAAFLGLFIISLYYKYVFKTKKNLRKIFNIKPGYNFNKKSLSNILFLISAFVLLAVFLTNIFSNNQKNNVVSSNTNVVFLLDVSKSMNSVDIKQNGYLTTRLNFSKQAIKNYISKHPNYKYGLVIFAGQAQAVLPLTNDIDIFSTILDGVDYRNLTKQGTNFLQGLKLAVERFKSYSGENLLVLISDGGDEGDYKGINIKIPSSVKTFVFGVGSKRGGKILLGQDAFGNYKYQTYKGEYVITKLNEQNLKQLANHINAKYFRLDKSDALDILDKYIKNKQSIKIKKTEKVKNLNTTNNIEYFFIKMALAFFVLSYLFAFIKGQENYLWVKNIIVFIKKGLKKPKKIKISTYDMLNFCNITLRNGIVHAIFALLSFGIYQIIYFTKRFKLRNCIVYGQDNCCSIKNLRNLVVIGGLLLLSLILGITGMNGFSSQLSYLDLVIMDVSLVLVFFTIFSNIILSILYLAAAKNKPAGVYLFVLFASFIFYIILSSIFTNFPEIVNLIFIVVFGLIFMFLSIYGWFVDNKIKKLIYKD